jgi:hypothetical protein
MSLRPRWARNSRAPRSLTLEQEARIGAVRRHPRLPLDDCLDALQATIPQLTRAARHRCLKRPGINHLPQITGATPPPPCQSSPIGSFHIDIAEVRTAAGKLQLLVAVDRPSTCADAELQTAAPKMIAAQFLRNLIAAGPYRLPTVLPEHGMQFTNRQRDPSAFQHIFDRVCNDYGLAHRLTNTTHPWTNGQVERMTRPLKEATVRK